MPKQKFTATIEQPEDYPGAALVIIPFDAKEVFGKSRVKVIATFDGVPYCGSITPMGGKPLLIVTKEIRSKIGKDHGDRVEVVIEEDKEPREIKIPHDFQKALKAAPGAEEAFRGFAYTYRKEYVQWIEGAKQESTRQNRIRKAVEKIAKGEKTIY